MAPTQGCDNRNYCINGLYYVLIPAERIVVGARAWTAASEIFSRRNREACNAKKVAIGFIH